MFHIFSYFRLRRCLCFGVGVGCIVFLGSVIIMSVFICLIWSVVVLEEVAFVLITFGEI